MSHYDRLFETSRGSPARWLVTGAAGFIGSHLVEILLASGQDVIGIDNFVTGSRENLNDVLRRDTSDRKFRFIEGDLCDSAVCRSAVEDAEIILHQAALGSVPRSMADPVGTHHANLTAFVNLLVAAREANVMRVVYASSSAVYGDRRNLPKTENKIGRPLSPYAVTKRANELYAEAFRAMVGFPLVGLRYFNVYGPRQDPNGPYAAVIPRWTNSLLAGERCLIYGDGETSRDFCYVQNAVLANLLAATAPLPTGTHRVYNVACGRRATLNELFRVIRDEVASYRTDAAYALPEFRDFRRGDVRHSQADLLAISKDLGYEPSHMLAEGIRETVRWYAERVLGEATDPVGSGSDAQSRNRAHSRSKPNGS